MMMKRITMIKKQGSKETLRLMTIEELAEQIRQGAFADLLSRFNACAPTIRCCRLSAMLTVSWKGRKSTRSPYPACSLP